MEFNFDEIRPFYDEELEEKFKLLSEEENFPSLVKMYFPTLSVDAVKAELFKTKTKFEFQKKFIFPVLKHIEKHASAGVSFSGDEVWKTDKNAFVYISNHRDIILDSALLNYVLLQNGNLTTEIAIGDNLLINNLIRLLVRINKSFIIERSASAGQMRMVLARQSAYIRSTITERNQSIWIAQREGRAKDSNDRTQESLLKMLALSGEGNFKQNIDSLNLCPLAISYEYDPCDYLKAKEFLQKKLDANFKKSPADDFQNMKQGVLGYKGRIHYHFCGKLDFEKISLPENKNEQVAEIAKFIDREIHLGYRIFDINRVAYDLLLGSEKYAKTYSAEKKKEVENYFSERVKMVDLPEKDEEFLRRKLLEMYANPLINQEKAFSETF